MSALLPRLTLSLALALLLGASAARAQGLGLDLSSDGEETPAGGEEGLGPVGLDLSGEVARTDLLPSIVLVGLDTPERAGAAASGAWFKALLGALRGTSERALPAASIKEARERLAEGYAAALRCTEASCMAEPADALDADLLVTARLALEDEGWTLRLWTYDRDRGRVETDALTGRSPKDGRFQKAGAELLAQRIQALARPRAVLQVKVNVPQAVVRLGERTLGVGNLERRVAPGEASLIIEAADFTPFAQKVSLRPGETTTVEAYLEVEGPAPDSPLDAVADAARKKPGASGPSLLGRPALYTAVAGLLAVGAGVAVGQQARQVGARAADADGNGIADITRSERLQAQKRANLATALVAAGGAAAGGSLLWLVLVPTRGEPSRAGPGVAPGGSAGGASSLHLFVSGSF